MENKHIFKEPILNLNIKKVNIVCSRRFGNYEARRTDGRTKLNLNLSGLCDGV